MKNVNEVVDIIYKKIESEINQEWSKLQIIRFVYLQVGLYLEKNTDFFLNDKLDSLKISDDEIRKIYEFDKIGVASRKKGEAYQIICKSAALVLKGIYDKLGIKSTMINTCGNEDEIRHWFLAVEDDNKKQYYLTLAADLPYIKNLFPTHHFANSISYYISNRITEESSAKDIERYREKLLNLKEEISEYVVFKSDNNYIILNKKDINKIKITGENITVFELSVDNINQICVPGNVINMLNRQYDIPEGVILKTSKKNMGTISIEYEEIDYTVLLNTTEKEDNLQALDESIGYGKLYETEKIATDKNFYLTSCVFAEENSEIFRLLEDSLNLQDNAGKKVSEVTINEAKLFVNRLNRYVTDYLNMKLKVSEDYSSLNSSNYSKEYIRVIFNKLGIPCSYLNLDISKIMKMAKKLIKDPEYLEIIDLLSNVMNIEQRFNMFITLKEEIKNVTKELEAKIKYYYESNGKDEKINTDIKKLYVKLVNLEKRLDVAMKNLSISKMNQVLHRVSHYFIKDSRQLDNEYISTEYIYNKFCLMFPLAFDCTYGDDIREYNTDFSNQGYSEQVVIIKEILKKIFSDLNENNCKQCENYTNKYSPVENRIRIFPLKNKGTGEYVIGFRFWAMNPNYSNEEEMNMIYIPSENLLREYNLSDRSKYIIVSSSIQNKVEKIEDIEDKGSIAK